MAYKHNISHAIVDIVHVKPNALIYIDDEEQGLKTGLTQ